jgi:hypothetical protein
MPCKLAADTKSFSRVLDTEFFKGLFQPVQTTAAGVKYIPLGSSNNILSSDTLIIRPAYEHLLPHIHNSLQIENKNTDWFRGAVTGTPGIGKTVFGLILLRHFLVDHQETVLYWLKDSVYLFSFNLEVRDYFGLRDADSEMMPNAMSPLYCGRWTTKGTSHLSDLIDDETFDFDMIFIHDPDEGDRTLSNMRTYIPRLIFILSHGHSLISLWHAKGNEMKFYYMPVWSKPEAERGVKLLKMKSPPGAQGKPKRKSGSSLADLSQNEIDDLYDRFGGCIRGWVSQDLWLELDGKIKEVVRDRGDNVLQKTPISRGSVIHLDVEFDESRPILDLKSAAEQRIQNEGDESDEDDDGPNTFDHYQYIFGSEDILEVFREYILNRGEEALRMCLTNWAGQSGFECVYGALFELHCHRMLENNNGQLKLRMRIVHSDASKNDDVVHNVDMPMTCGTLRYPSNEPAILEEDEYDEDVKTLNKYIWPISSTHPTYDSAFVVNGKDLRVKELEEENIALLLQMTVSGATGLPRRPEHSVRQHIRSQFERVFKKKIPCYKQSGKAYTAFMVPTECFSPFLFQKESALLGGTSQKQPEMQLVFEIPKVFTYKKGSSRGTSRAVVASFATTAKKRKRFHAYDHTKLSQTD